MSSSRIPYLKVILIVSVCLAFVSCQPKPVPEPPAAPTNYLEETEQERDQRMQWWREARFGMFIHWGLYAVPAGEYDGKRSEHIGEWIKGWADIPDEEYDKYLPQFNPVKFDPAEWVRIAKDAGMKYLVITSKHHEGFSLFETKVSDYDVVDSTPYGKDLLAQLKEECEKQGIRFCFYYSILDWHHPSQYVELDDSQWHLGYGRNKMHEGRKAEYVEYMKTQLKELITGYGPEVLWFDGQWVEWWTEEDGKDLYNYVRGLKPDIIINNRVGKGREGPQGLTKGPGYAGDFGTPEQKIPPTGLPGVDWESCMTMNDTWGFKSYDDNWKSTETVLRNLIDIASKGGNYLLNVGPTAEGLIPQPSIDVLRQIGEWMKVNGESIYGTTASPFETPAWGRATQKPGKVYLHIFEWPKGSLEVPAVAGSIQSAYLLSDAGKEPLKVNEKDEKVLISVPNKAPDPIASVIVLEYK